MRNSEVRDEINCWPEEDDDVPLPEDPDLQEFGPYLADALRAALDGRQEARSEVRQRLAAGETAEAIARELNRRWLARLEFTEEPTLDPFP